MNGPAEEHNFTGIDGRCVDCDVRPGGKAAQQPCSVWVATDGR